MAKGPKSVAKKAAETIVVPSLADAEPLRLAADADTGDRLLVYATDAGIKVDLRVVDQTFWASQQQMAAMFGVAENVITYHLKNIFEDGELDEAATTRKIRGVRQEGARQVSRELTYYNLNAIISVGYRVGGKLGTLFRIWATERLVQLLTKGFVIDDERLKNPDGRPDFFDELLDRIRDIRSSEARMWTRVLELASFCNDYDANDRNQHIQFFAEIQNTMHWAVSQQTAAEIIHARVDANAPNAGLTHIAGRLPTVKEAQTAKNFLAEGEITALNAITSLTLEFFESQAEQRRPTMLSHFIDKMRDLVRLDGRPLKQTGYAGAVSRTQAEAKASEQVRLYKERVRVEAENTGEQALKKLTQQTKTRARKRPGST